MFATRWTWQFRLLLELHHSFQEGLRRILTQSQFERLEHELRERD